MSKMPIRGVSLNVKIFGHGFPMVLMHGGPGADLYTMMAFKPLADQLTLVFYDQRCNGRSTGAEVTSMTMDNLTADADALRLALGYEKWAVLGHSFGGYVALEYALRYPQNLSHLLLVNSGADYTWARRKAPEELAKRGFNPATVELARRHLNGQFKPQEMFGNLMKLGNAYNPHTSLSQLPHLFFSGIKSKLRPEAAIFAEQGFLQTWTVMDRLDEIHVPTLLIAGREDFIFPPAAEEELAAKIPGARLVLIDRAGHNPHDEQPADVLRAVREFFVAYHP